MDVRAAFYDCGWELFEILGLGLISGLPDWLVPQRRTQQKGTGWKTFAPLVFFVAADSPPATAIRCGHWAEGGSRAPPLAPFRAGHDCRGLMRTAIRLKVVTSNSHPNLSPSSLLSFL